MLLSNTTPISLRDTLAALTAPGASVLQSNTFNTPTSNATIVAPSAARAVEILIWGGGGSGRSGTSAKGGGGGSFVRVICPVIGGQTTFYYGVGAGGTARTNANGLGGGSSNVRFANVSSVSGFGVQGYSASGGGGGTTLSGSGGITSLTNGPTSSTPVKVNVAESGATTTTATGGNAGGQAYGGGTGGAGGTSGTAGTAPGGGGGAASSSLSASGAGAAGRVEFKWYNVPASGATELRDLLAGGTYVKNGSTGVSGAIPSSGSLDLKDFLGYQSLKLSNTSNLVFSSSAQDYDNAVRANVSATFHANGSIQAIEYEDGLPIFQIANVGTGQWLETINGAPGTVATTPYQIQFIRTASSGVNGPHPRGSAVNTWINANSTINWYVDTLDAGGPPPEYIQAGCQGYLLIRIASSGTVIMNAAIQIDAEASNEENPLP